MVAEAMRGSSATVLEIGAVTAVPALAMVLGSVAMAASSEPSEKMQARLQHFSGGLLIGAVITDIFPILRNHLVGPLGEERDHVAWRNFLAGIAGFSSALLLMYGVRSLGLEELSAVEAVKPASTPCTEPLLRLSASPLAQCGPLPRTCSAGVAGTDVAQERHSGLHSAVARLTARAAALGQLACVDEVDREAVDEEIHGLDFLLDVAQRRCQSESVEPLDANCATRLRLHVADLAEDISRARRLDAGDLEAIDDQLRIIAGRLRRIHQHAEQRGPAFRRWGPRPQPALESTAASPEVHGARAQALSEGLAAGVRSPAGTLMPWGLVLAVLVDSAVDGMLIGLAGSVALTSGWLMAMATAIEMGFLGYSFACAAAGPAALRGGPVMRLAVLGLPPATMLASSIAASMGASNVEGRPTFVGLIAFALAAVLFLVVEELLLEAHEKEGSDAWHISVWLYVGLLLSICLDVAA